MTEKEKLVGLLTDVLGHSIARKADYLISNGVTVQQWIPVTERLPNGDWQVPCIVLIKGHKKSAVRFFERTTVRKKRVERFLFPWGTISDEKITHWMPLPEPPKEET